MMKLREKSNGEADVFPLAEGNMAATNRVSRVAASIEIIAERLEWQAKTAKNLGIDGFKPKS